MALPPAVAHPLYDEGPGDFVAARTALVRELRAAGERDLAAVVGKLARPSLDAWALNRVARDAPDLVGAALEAAAALRAASDAAIGGDPGALRSATAAERAATRVVVDLAVGHLGPARAATARPALEGAVRAAALDDEVAEALRLGVLRALPAAPGFGFTDATPAPTLRLVVDGRQAEDRARSERRVADLEARAVELAAAADAAEASAQAARAAADQARRRADEASARAQAARAELSGPGR